jgi:hypothetical protein
VYFVERQGRRYLYETKRRSGKVIKTYRGCGWNAEALKTVVDDVNVQYRAWRAKKKAVRHEYFDEIRRRRRDGVDAGGYSFVMSPTNW